MARRLRTLALFFLCGGLLHGLRQGLSERPAPPEVTVVVRQGQDEAEAIREELLVREGLGAGWALTDPVIRDRLVRNMRFAEGQGGDAVGDDDALLARAVSLDMHTTDPVVRRRLMWHARQKLRAAIELPTPSDEVLRAHLQQHLSEFQTPARLHFKQLFLSAQRRGAALEADAQALGAALGGRGEQDPQLPPTDPSLLPRTMHESASRIDARFGEGFARQLVRAPLSRWSGPYRSTFGVHFVWLHGRTAASHPALGDVRPRVLRHWQVATRDREMQARIRSLEARYAVRVQGGST